MWRLTGKQSAIEEKSARDESSTFNDFDGIRNIFKKHSYAASLKLPAATTTDDFSGIKDIFKQKECGFDDKEHKSDDFSGIRNIFKCDNIHSSVAIVPRRGSVASTPAFESFVYVRAHRRRRRAPK
jgi:hypothetical protein